MKPQKLITLANIEIISKDHMTLTYRIIGDDARYQVTMRNVKKIEYVDDSPVITVII